jgi:iron(III) transport system permease protein
VGRLALAAALAVAGVAIVAPLCGMIVASLRVYDVVTPARTYRASGEVTESNGTVRFQWAASREAPDQTQPLGLPASGTRIERRWSLDHYRAVWASPRTPKLLWNSSKIAAGATLLALALGLPAAFVHARTRLAGRRLLTILFATPLLLPSFFVAMALASNAKMPLSIGSVLAGLGLSGATLQVATAIACFGVLLYPIVALVVGRAMAAVPAGLVESARLLGGPAAARRRVVVPTLLPSVLAAAVLVFVLALADFAVPDLLGVFLPPEAVPVNVFATEVFLQWTKNGNVGRAVATGAPFMAVTVVAVFLAVALAGRGPAGFLGGSHRVRPRVSLSPAGTAVAWTFVLLLVGVSVVLPVAAVTSWGFSFAGVPVTLRATPSLGEDTARWLRIGLATAALATATALPVARFAARGGRIARAVAIALGALPLAAPGMVLSAGTLLLWSDVPWMGEGILRPTLCLAGRFFPYALLACWLAVREVEPGLEESARLLGAGPGVRARRVWGPLSRRGVLAGFLLVLVLALRELDALVLLEPAVLPVRIYDKVHFGRTGQVADLSMLLLGIVVIPAVLALLLLARSPRTGPLGDEPSGPGLRTPSPDVQ